MSTPHRPPRPTVKFIDDYCQNYQHLFCDVRNYEAFKLLHLGLLSELPRKSFPRIARAVGLSSSQKLNHFLTEAGWETSLLREVRLEIIRQLIGKKEIILCIDETGDVKKGKATDYVAKQYIGNLGKTERGIVSVNAYGIVEGITYPLLFKIFKPKGCLKPEDTYKTKPQLAVEILQELKALGFQIKLVLADSLYGESSSVIEALERLHFDFIVAIRSNHGVLLGPGQKVRYNQWQAYQQQLSHRQSEARFIREIIFGKRRMLRYYQITKGETIDPTGDNSWYIMTNLEGKIQRTVAQLYSLRNWIEYGFKQVKNELGWADYRLTNYSSIERWWEMIFSAYLLVSLQAHNFQLLADESINSPSNNSTSLSQFISPWKQHPWWEPGLTWKSSLNNLRLLIEPFLFYCLLSPWLNIFPIPGFRRKFSQLIQFMDTFPTFIPRFSVPSFRVA